MKRTYPANIDGQIFYIDEDAYLMLQDYLQELKNTFKGAEGTEIVADIESRIRELFQENIDRGANVIVKTDVMAVIETMGRPEQISDSETEGETHGEMKSADSPAEKEGKPIVQINLPTSKKLYRSMKNKVLGGVIGGLAVYLGWNANVMRILLSILLLFSFSFHGFLPITIIYLVAWMIIPPADTPRKILEMRGEPVTVDTLGQTFIANNPDSTVESTAPDDGSGNLPTMVLGIIGKFIMGFLGIIAAIGGVGAIIALISIITCAICVYGFGMPMDIMSLPWSRAHGFYIVSIVSWLLVGIVACVAMAWASACTLFKIPAASRTTKITAFIMEILLISFAITITCIAVAM